MIRNRAGYPLPDNPQPEGTRCIMVHIPDDPLYLYEFLDAYEYFGKWVAWERDEAHNGALAAASWRGAIEKTRETLLAGCGNIIGDDEMSDILDKLDEISERLKELEDMDVIVTQTVNGCGCGDGDTSTSTVTTPLIDPTDTGISPPYDETVYTPPDAAKCRAANWLVDKTIYFIRGLANIGASQMFVVAVGSFLLGLFAVFNGIPGDEIAWGSVVFSVAVLIVTLNALNDFQVDDLDVLSAEIESLREDFVCVMYGWTTASELSASLLNFLYSRVDETATAVGWSSETKEKIKDVFSKVFGSELANYVVQNVEKIVPAGFVAQHDCICGATGDSCPSSNLVIGALGDLPAGDLTGTTQGFASLFNPQTGYHEILFELADNYCVTIDYGEYSPDENHEKCTGGAMVASDGSCIRRFTARSLAPFATSITFNEQSADCDCTQIEPVFQVEMDKGTPVDFALHDTIIKDKHVTMRSESGPYNDQKLRFKLYNPNIAGAVQQFVTIHAHGAIQPLSKCGNNDDNNFLWRRLDTGGGWIGQCTMPSLETKTDGGTWVVMRFHGTVNENITISWNDAYMV